MKTINVYFCNSLERNFIKVPAQGDKPNPLSLATLLHALTVTDNNKSFSFCIDGAAICNVDPRDLVVIFTYHLDTQVKAIAKKIREIMFDGEPITLNLYGATRGGAAALLLCQKLKKIPNDRLNINVMCLDPLGGNLPCTVSVDTFFQTKMTLTNNVLDLEKCKNLSSLLFLFTPQFTDNLLIGEAAHHPVLPSHINAQVSTDMTPGISQTSDLTKSVTGFSVDSNKHVIAGNDATIVAFQRIVEFLQKAGTKFATQGYTLHKNLLGAFDRNKDYLDYLRKVYQDLSGNRDFIQNHSRPVFPNSEIDVCESKDYVNTYHQKLLGVDLLDESKNILSINDKIKPRKSGFSINNAN